MTPLQRLWQGSRERLFAALDPIAASSADYVPFDASRRYTPKELEPYDALADRYIRAVETALRFFRTHGRLMFGEASDTCRDLLQRMHKLRLVAEPMLWIEMRDLRNRIVQDYLPEQVQRFYEEMMARFVPELLALRGRAAALAPVEGS